MCYWGVAVWVRWLRGLGVAFWQVVAGLWGWWRVTWVRRVACGRGRWCVLATVFIDEVRGSGSSSAVDVRVDRQESGTNRTSAGTAIVAAAATAAGSVIGHVVARLCARLMCRTG